MIIGAKRKEEVIKMKRWGMYDQYVSMSVPVRHLSVAKNVTGAWQIWEMVTESAGQPIAAYRTKKQAVQKMLEIACEKNLAIKVNK